MMAGRLGCDRISEEAGERYTQHMHQRVNPNTYYSFHSLGGPPAWYAAPLVDVSFSTPSHRALALDLQSSHSLHDMRGFSPHQAKSHSALHGIFSNQRSADDNQSQVRQL